MVKLKLSYLITRLSWVFGTLCLNCQRLLAFVVYVVGVFSFGVYCLFGGCVACGGFLIDCVFVIALLVVYFC